MINITIINKPVISGVTLVNALTDADIQPIVHSSHLFYSKMGTSQVNIRANTNSPKVGSVKFVLDGVTKVENNAPYAWAGDALKTGGGTDYKAFTLKEGTHLLTVTAYSEANASGKASEPYTITFNVHADKSFRMAAEESTPKLQRVHFTIAPNPFSQRTTLLFTPTEDGPVTVEVYNMQGILVKQIYQGIVETGKRYEWELEAGLLPAGPYVGRLQMGAQIYQQKLILSK